MNNVRLFLWHPADDSYLVDSETHGLPSIEVAPASRLPHVALRWCTQHHLRASFITTIGGVGRTDGTVHWGVWLRLNSPPRQHRAVQLEVIEAGNRDPVAPHLTAALRAIRRGASHSAWIGRNPYWSELALAWIARQHSRKRIGPLVPIRADGNCIVARSAIDRRTVFFTTRACRFDDARLCDALDAHAPGVFPRTLAYDDAKRWWLAADVEAGDSKVFIGAAANTPHRLSQVMRMIANVQVATVGSHEVRGASFDVSQPAVCDGVTRTIAAVGVESPIATRDGVIAVNGVWTAARAGDVPFAWIHSDPSPDNVRVTNHGMLRLIDFEDPWYGPAPLMGALVLHSMGRRCQWRSEELRVLCDSAWTDYLRALDLTPERHELDSWLRLAALVRLIRRVDASSQWPGRLLYEETPRRLRAIATDLQRLCGPS